VGRAGGWTVRGGRRPCPRIKSGAVEAVIPVRRLVVDCPGRVRPPVVGGAPAAAAVPPGRRLPPKVSSESRAWLRYASAISEREVDSGSVGENATEPEVYFAFVLVVVDFPVVGERL